METDRWPPVYDADALKGYIAKLAASDADLHKVFYASSTESGGASCQGDIVERQLGIPGIDEQGEPTLDGTSRYWLVIGNTCDFDRPVDEAAWTQVVPIDELSLDDPLAQQSLPDARSYRYARHFFLPAWTGASPNTLYSANFLRPVAVHKAGIGAFKVVARMDRPAWILLHSCLVRFLARDDGRFDE